MLKKILITALVLLPVLSCGCESQNIENYTATNDVVILQATQDEVKKDSMPNEYKINDFDIIYQMPELPTGCEITAMTMALNYYGFEADKIQMATEYLPWEYPEYYYDEDGKLIGNDLYNCFQGDPTDVSGIICGPGAITKAANEYLKDIKSNMKAKNISGSKPNELYELVSKDTPVVVWTTIEMGGRGELNGWYTENGGYFDWGPFDHCAVLIGYTGDTVTIADPIVGEIEYDKTQFEMVFSERRNWCVVLE